MISQESQNLEIRPSRVHVWIRKMSESKVEESSAEEETANKPEYARSSSFARSFFTAGTDHPALDLTMEASDADDKSLSDNIPVSRARRAGRLRSSVRHLFASGKRKSHSSRGSYSSRSMEGPSQELGDDDDQPRLQSDEQDAAAMPPPLPQIEARQMSWYQDALEQGISEENLEMLLSATDLSDPATKGPSLVFTTSGGPLELAASLYNESDSSFVSSPEGFDSDDVLEQFRIMAFMESKRLFRDRTGGLDLDELREKQKERDGKTFTIDVSPPPRPPLPDFSDIPFQKSSPPNPLLSNPLPRRTCFRTGREEPHLQIGKVVEPDRLAFQVECLGCKQRLSVSHWAYLVKCAECSTVSPVTPVASEGVSVQADVVAVLR